MFSHRPSKSVKRGFGQRRTVVQLNDEPRRQPTYGFGYKPSDEAQKSEAASNALSGIMNQYAMDSYSDDDSAEDDDEKIENQASIQLNDKRAKQCPQFVAATDNRLPTVKTNEVTTTNDKPSKIHDKVSLEKNPGKGDGKDDIDMKLKDFLAEIDSIEVPENPLALEDVAEGKTLEGKPECDADNGVGVSEDDSNAPIEPEAPTTVWQHCLDDSTQCYYYWNTETNEVTWEIPPEYSQYLLRLKEHERLLAKYEKDIAEWKKVYGSKKQKKSTKKDRKHKKKVEEGEELIEPLVSYPPIDEEEDEEANEKDTSVVYGPEKPPNDLMDKLQENKTTGPEQSHEEVVSASSCNENWDSHGMNTDLLSAELETEVSTTDSVLQSRNKKYHRHHKLSRRLVEEEHISSSSKAETHKHRTKAHDQVSKLKPHITQTNDISDGKTSEANSEAVSKSQDGATMPSCQLNTEDMYDEEEFVNRELEEPIFSHYDYVNKKYEGDQGDDVNLGIDDIDRELELALEKRQVKTGISDKKRKPMLMTENGDSSDHTKRRKIEPETECVAGRTWISSLRDDIKTKVNGLAEVFDLSSMILEKLEFLETPQSNMSDFQILLTQTETRLTDWKLGVLSTEYLLQKLQEAANILVQYEQTSVPSGWSCSWDRTFKRYFYRNDITGETGWTYPQPDGDKEKNQEEIGSVVRQRDGGNTQRKFSANLQSTTQVSGDVCLVPIIESSDTPIESGVPIAIPSDLLTWAANPPPPPPATPPPPSPYFEAQPSQLSPEQTSDVEMSDENKRWVNDASEHLPQDSTSENYRDYGTSAVGDPELVCYTSAHQVVRGQDSPSVVSAHPVSISHVSTVCMPTSPESHISNSTAVASTSTSHNVPLDELIDGTPMEDQTSHPVKEKKKKKDKLQLGSSLLMKKKNVSSLVEKWQKIQDNVSKEIEKERNKQMKLAELSGKINSSKID